MNDNERKKFNMNLAIRARELRVSKGWTQDYVAYKTGISQKFLYEIENGIKGCSAFVALNLAKTLEVSVEYLITGKGGLNEITKELKNLSKSINTIIDTYDK